MRWLASYQASRRARICRCRVHHSNRLGSRGGKQLAVEELLLLSVQWRGTGEGGVNATGGPLLGALPPRLRHLVALKLETAQVFYIAFFGCCSTGALLGGPFACCLRSLGPFPDHRVLPEEGSFRACYGSPANCP